MRRPVLTWYVGLLLLLLVIILFFFSLFFLLSPNPILIFFKKNIQSSCFHVSNPGYICGVGEITSTPTKCGGPTKICPEGSTKSADVHPGYYSIGYEDEEDEDPNLKRSSEVRCGPGFWCANGTKRKCAPGVYGTSFGLLVPECDAICPQGFFCPAGTVSPVPCGRVDRFCPIGSSEPLEVQKGYHTTTTLDGLKLPRLYAARVG
jgi:hypothetical protein